MCSVWMPSWPAASAMPAMAVALCGISFAICRMPSERAWNSSSLASTVLRTPANALSKSMLAFRAPPPAAARGRVSPVVSLLPTSVRVREVLLSVRSILFICRSNWVASAPTRTISSARVATHHHLPDTRRAAGVSSSQPLLQLLELSPGLFWVAQGPLAGLRFQQLLQPRQLLLPRQGCRGPGQFDAFPGALLHPGLHDVDQLPGGQPADLPGH